MSTALQEISEEQIQALIHALDSLSDGELAVTILVACGARAVPYLAQALLRTAPHAIALPRCRMVHALGELGAYETLIAYLDQYTPPADPVVLFAEDAVRGAVAHELLRWPTEVVFTRLMQAATQRASNGVVLALGEFRRKESIPLLFGVLEDDLCREDAKEVLRKMPEETRAYAELVMAGRTPIVLDGAASLYTRRAVLELLHELGVQSRDWPLLRRFLHEQDPGVVIATAQIGFKIAPEAERAQLVEALFRIAAHLNWVQETDVEQLLDQAPELARALARAIAAQRKQRGERVNWMSPLWRVLRHILKEELTGNPGTV